MKAPFIYNLLKSLLSTVITKRLIFFYTIITSPYKFYFAVFPLVGPRIFLYEECLVKTGYVTPPYMASYRCLCWASHLSCLSDGRTGSVLSRGRLFQSLLYRRTWDRMRPGGCNLQPLTLGLLRACPCPGIIDRVLPNSCASWENKWTNNQPNKKQLIFSQSSI